MEDFDVGEIPLLVVFHIWGHYVTGAVVLSSAHKATQGMEISVDKTLTWMVTQTSACPVLTEDVSV